MFDNYASEIIAGCLAVILSGILSGLFAMLITGRLFESSREEEFEYKQVKEIIEKHLKFKAELCKPRHKR